jgi:hypothetical protein
MPTPGDAMIFGGILLLVLTFNPIRRLVFKQGLADRTIRMMRIIGVVLIALGLIVLALVEFSVFRVPIF